jgi:hypothetical protein
MTAKGGFTMTHLVGPKKPVLPRFLWASNPDVAIAEFQAVASNDNVRDAGESFSRKNCDEPPKRRP